MSMFFERLNSLTEEKAVSSEQLSCLTGISLNRICKLKKGTVLPDLDEIILLSDIFGVTVDYLAGKTEIKGNKPSSYTLECELTALRSFLLLAVEIIDKFLEPEKENGGEYRGNYFRLK